MAGGALGAGARFLTGRATLGWWGPGYPYGTLAANLLGGFLMGLVVGLLARGSADAENLRLFGAVGVLGGYTTFSAFSLEVVTMLEQGDLGTALAYVLLSVGGALLALWAGLSLARVAAA
ncbi:fluoride efflux transporter CrcB [Sphingomonas aracearum]|uniref:Fluoride-specific ion channel FluC n=2 Tax=Sphingomonas aracearum TaxID=2283317 RepID=A0A369VV27_9SPHN|nr:fluoride efflux transporter CrcB [Sphingomonas aracearum]